MHLNEAVLPQTLNKLDEVAQGHRFERAPLFQHWPARVFQQTEAQVFRILGAFDDMIFVIVEKLRLQRQV